MQLYKGRVYILGRSSETEKLYSAEEASMDTLEVGSPVTATVQSLMTAILTELFSSRHHWFHRYSVNQVEEVRSSEGRGRRKLEQGTVKEDLCR